MFEAALAASALSNIVPAYLQYRAATNAARLQAGAAQDATAEQRRQYDLSRGDLEPWRESGRMGLEELSRQLGLGGDFSSSNLGRKFTLADFENDPVNRASFDFGMKQGTSGIDRMMASRGLRNSGATLKALTKFGTDYTGQKAGESYNRFVGDQGNIFNRLAAISRIGQTATNQTATMGANMANNIGDIGMGAANARGAAEIARANAIGGGLSNFGNSAQSWYMLNELNKPPGGYLGEGHQPGINTETGLTQT